MSVGRLDCALSVESLCLDVGEMNEFHVIDFISNICIYLYIYIYLEFACNKLFSSSNSLHSCLVIDNDVYIYIYNVI